MTAALLQHNTLAIFFKEIGKLYHGAGEGLVAIADTHNLVCYMTAMHPEFLKESDAGNALIQMMLHYLSYIGKDLPDTTSKRAHLQYLSLQGISHTNYFDVDFTNLGEQVKFLKESGVSYNPFLEFMIQKWYEQDARLFASIVVGPFTENTEAYIKALNPNMPRKKRELLEAKMEALRNKFRIPETKDTAV